MKYWAYINNEIKGPFEIEELVKVDGFSPSTLVCPQSSVEEETKEWKEARELPEIAILLTKELPQQAETKPEIKELSQPKNKEEIIIERFGIETIFTPASDIEETHFRSSVDPLTLSQIRRRAEPQQGTNLPSESETIKEDTSPKQQDIIPEIEIPSTDELLKSVETPTEEVSKISIEEKPETLDEKKEIQLEPTPSPVIDMDKERKESKDYEVTQQIKQEHEIDNIKDEIIAQLQMIINEKLSLLEEKIKRELSQEKEREFETLKNDLVSIIEARLSSSTPSSPLTPEDNSLKKEIDELKTLTTHLEIEIRDLRSKTEILENKTKVEAVQLTRENLPSQPTPSAPTQQHEEEKPTKKNLAKTLILIILIPLALFSILFMLRQFGIFDPLSLLSSTKQEDMQTASIQPQKPPQQEDFISQSDSSDTTPPSQTPPPSLEQTYQPPPAEAERVNEIPPELILNEVKNYKINSPYNLERTINIVLKSKRADLSSVKWEATPIDGGRFFIVVTAKGLKPVEFRFEFEPKTKLLQPLNTLSINTLKMMMGETQQKDEGSKAKKKNLPKKITKQTQKQQQKEIAQTNEEESEKPSQPPIAEESNEEEYLIIGE